MSESSVYRILKTADLITSPAYVLTSASDRFQHPTERVHEMWQTYFCIIGWGWYYLSAVLDDSSRYSIPWRLSPSTDATDVKQTLDQALAITGVEQVRVKHRPRLLSDNGLAYMCPANFASISASAVWRIPAAVRIPRRHRVKSSVITEQ